MEPEAIERSLRDRVTSGLETIVHWLMFGVSGVFSVRLFMELSSTVADKVLYSLLAVGFEGTKIVLWEIGNRRQKLIALFMVAMSLLASTGAALAVAERTQNAGADESRLSAFDSRLSGIDTALDQCRGSIENLQAQVGRLPPTYVTSALRLQDQIERLYERQAGLEDERLAAVEEASRYRSEARDTSSMVMFKLMAEAVGTSQERFVLYFMLAVAILLEVGALGTTQRGDKVGSSNQEPPETAFEPCSKCGSKRTKVELTNDGRLVTIECVDCRRSTGARSSFRSALAVWNGPAVASTPKKGWKFWKKS